MKLRELKESKSLTELDWSPLIGHYGQSFIGDRPEGVDRQGAMGKNIFARNFMQKAISGLDSAIKSGLIDPNAASAVVQPQQTQTTQTLTPSQVRQQKQGAAAKNAQASMKPKTATKKAPVPQTPEQIRQQKQAAAAQAARAGMTDKPVAKRLTPAQIRQQKQAIAAQAIDAQQSIASKAAEPLASNPEQIRQQKQAAAAQAAQAGMTDKPAAPALGTTLDTSTLKKQPTSAPVTQVTQPTAGPTASAQADSELPGFMQSKIKGSQVANNPEAELPGFLRSKIKGKPNVVGENYNRLNTLLENIININEAGGQSISQYIQNLFMQFMQGVPMNDPNTTQQIKTLADEVQATYAKDKGKNALTKLADLGWAVSHSPEATQQAAGQPAATAGQTQTASGQQNTQGQTIQQPNPAADQKSIIGVKQINKIIPTLRKRDLLSVKKNVDNTLAGRGNTATVAPEVKAPTVDNTIKMPKGKVRAAKEGGVTPEEQAKFDEKVRQAMSSQK